MSKISSGTIMLAFVAVLMGLFGAYVVREILRRPPVREARKIDKVVIPMASMPLKAGRTVTIGDVALARMTRAEMQERGIRGAFMTDTHQIIGRVLKEDMPRGTRFDTTLFYPDGMRPGLVERLKPGLRAVTIPVWSDDALLGFAGPNSWVDVIFRSATNPESLNNYQNGYGSRPAREDYARHYATWRGGTSNSGNLRIANADVLSLEQTVTLLENVQVLAVDRETYEGMNVESPKTDLLSVTLAVTPEQATSLRIVDGRGELSLTLRNPEDKATARDSVPRTMKDIIDIPEAERIERNDMEVYRGFRRNRIDFVGSGINARRWSAGGTRHQWTVDERSAADQPTEVAVRPHETLR